MTAICGVYNIFDNQGCDADIKQLSQPFSIADISDLWIRKNVALGQRTNYNTPESLTEHYPLEDKDAGLTIVGDIRLDDRDTLISKLRWQPADTPDSRLTLEAYKKWGVECTEHLSGDYAFVIWDAPRQQLHCFTDHFAHVPLYYYFNGQKFLFATDIRQLVAVDGVPNQLNENKLATLVVDASQSMFRTETWFKDIYPIPAATILTVDNNGLKLRKYWEPAIGTPLQFKNDGEFREAFQEVFFAAVRDRLRSNYPVTALLSGGLDSSSVVAVAAKILEQENKTLNVFSSVLPDGDESNIEDERYYIDLFRQFPNVNIHYVNEEGKGFFSNINKLRNEQTVAPLTSRHFLYDEFAERAAGIGSRTILDGISGELGATSHGYGIYAEQLKKLRWPWLWKELKARKQIAGEPVVHNLLSQVIKPYLPDAVVYNKRGEKELLIRNKNTPIHPNLAEALEKKLALRKEELERRNTNPSADHRYNQINTIKAVQHKGNPRMTFETGEYRYPFRDKRVIKFGINAPAEYKIMNGYKRNIVRSGLDGILPKEIQYRTDKKPFSPDYFSRYNAQIGAARQFLDSIADNDPVRNIVDVEKLKVWANIPVSDTGNNNNTVNIALHYLPQGIYLINFLRRFSEFQ